jgi:hypothetical protein
MGGRSQKGPQENSKGTRGYGKGPVPPPAKEHIANEEQIMYIAAVALPHPLCGPAAAFVAGPQNPGHKEHDQ